MIPALPGDIFHQGQVLNNTWTIEGVLGRGGTGEVYRARSLVTGRVVAIKALAAQFSGDEGYLELMRREEAMRDIVHDAVVRYSDCSRTAEGHVFLVMDYIDGPALSEVMAARRLEPRELLILAHRVAEGLVAAHARGTVHRDLSPDNIILRDGRAEEAVLIDFGIAKDTAAGAHTIVGNQFAGKYEYAAPEQFDGRAVPASDLYALGATLAAAARGAVPSAGQTPAEMMRRKAEPLDLAGLPEPLAGLIGWLSAPDLSRRAPSAAAVVARLDTLLKGRTQPAARRGAARAAPPMPKAARRRPIWLVALLLVLALAGGALLWREFAAPGLPLADPWRLEARSDPPQLAGQAPDRDSAGRIAAAFGEATGAAPPPDALVLARGMPSPGWAGAMADLFPLLDGLADWTVGAEAMAVRVAGSADSAGEREAIAARLEGWARAAGLALTLDLSAPVLLTPEALRAALDAHAACGPLASDLAPGGAPEGATVTVTGNLPDPVAEAALVEALRPLLAGRALRLETETLSPSLCPILAALAGLPGGGLGIRLSEARRPQPSLTGIYRPGDNPVADVLVPAALVSAPGAQLWIAVEAMGKAYGIRPNPEDGETRLDRIGEAEGGVRMVRALWDPAAIETGSGRLGFTVGDKDFGKAAIIVLVTRGPLFPAGWPDSGNRSQIAPASLAAALAARRAAQPDLILAAGYRVLDLRP